MAARKRKRQVIEVETYNCSGAPIIAYFDGGVSWWRYRDESIIRPWSEYCPNTLQELRVFAAKIRVWEHGSHDEIGEWAFIAEQLIAEGLL